MSKRVFAGLTSGLLVVALIMFSYSQSQTYSIKVELLHSFEDLFHRHPQRVAFSPDSTKLVAVTEEQGDFAEIFESRRENIWLWDVATGKELWAVESELQSDLWSVAFHPSGDSLVTGGYNAARLWSTESGEMLKEFRDDGSIFLRLAFNNSGSELATGHDLGKGNFVIWDIALGDVKLSIERREPVGGLSYQPNGKVVAFEDRGEVKEIDLNSYELLTSNSFAMGSDNAVRALSYSPNGKLIASANQEGLITIWNTQSGDIVASIQAHPSIIDSLSWHPTEAILASAGRDPFVKFWDTNTFELLYEFSVDSYASTSAVFSPDGRLMATVGTREKTVKIWNVTF